MILSFLQYVQPVLPLVLIGLITVLCVLIAFWSYRPLDITPSWKKLALITLRTAALLVLALLLLHPFFVREQSIEKKPVMHLYVDNSQSITVERGDYRGLVDVNTLVADLSESLKPTFDLVVFPFGSTVSGSGLGSDRVVDSQISGTSNRTNLQRVIEHMVQYQNELDAAVLISDGIFTEGRNPVFTAQTIATPVFTIPVGDTLETADLILTAEPLPGQIQAGTTLLLRSELRQYGLAPNIARIRLTVNGTLVHEEEIPLGDSPSLHTIEKEFTIPDDRSGESDGLAEFLWQVEAVEGELTEENNRVSQLADIQDQSRTILSVAFEVHPDVATFRRQITSDLSYALVTADYLRRGAVTGTDPFTLAESPDLVLIHGLPEPGHPFLDWLSERDDVPQIWALAPIGVERLRRSQYGNNTVPLSLSGNGGFLRVSVRAAEETVDETEDETETKELHPILEFGSPDYRRFPDLMVHQIVPEVASGTTTLLNATYAGTETDIPILAVLTVNGQKITLLNAFGWHRWEQSSQEEAAGAFDALFDYILSWTMTPPGQQQLSLTPAKETFSNLESVSWTARLLNERNVPEPDAIVEVEIRRIVGFSADLDENAAISGDASVSGNSAISGDEAIARDAAMATGNSENSTQQRFRMSHDENGVYRLNAGRFPEGNYRVRAIATKGSRQLGTTDSQFRVGSSPEEFVNTRRNDALLEQIAEGSGGYFVDQAPAQTLSEILRREQLTRMQIETLQQTRYLIDWPIWFLLVMILLSGEWVLRRSLSLP
jgi:hypothetical protein